MPASPMMIFIAVQLRSVCGTVIPRYSLTIQNPASLTCEIIEPPQQIARTSISGL